MFLPHDAHGFEMLKCFVFVQSVVPYCLLFLCLGLSFLAPKMIVLLTQLDFSGRSPGMFVLLESSKDTPLVIVY